MSQRLIKPGLSPLAGQVIGYGKRGPIRLQAGGAPESGDDTPPEGAEGGDDDSGAEDDDEEEDPEGEGNDKGTKDEEETVPKWKADRLEKRMKAADQRAAGLQKQLEELKANADVPAEIRRELEDIKAQVAAKDEAIRKATAERDRMSVKLAAVTLKGAPDWEDIDTALSLADLSEVEVDEDTGRIDTRALKAALTGLAKEKPFLVKRARTADSTQQQASSSTTMNRRRGGQNNTPTRETLANRFPALRQQ